MVKFLLTFIAPALLGMHFAGTTPGAPYGGLMEQLTISKEDMMRYGRKIELLKFSVHHESLSLQQKANGFSHQIALGMEQIENFSLDRTVGRHFDVATRQAGNQKL